MFWRKRGEKLVLVDVDGTISPSQYPSTAKDYFYSAWNGGHYFSSKLREELASLPARKLWLTAWGEEAEDTFACGWETVTSKSDSFEWKVEAVEELARRKNVEGIVWFDDEFSRWRAPQGEAPILCLPCDSAKGLTPAHLKQARAFLEEL